MGEQADSVAAGLIGRLQRAWNEADGRAFGEPFTADAHFVDIRGEHHRGREAIAAGHQAIFDSIYEGSTDYELTGARELSDGVILVTPQGPQGSIGALADEHSAVQTSVLVRGDQGREIAGFHNTLVGPQRR